MSTEYYGLRAPFTAIRIIDGPKRIVQLDIDGTFAGELACAPADCPIVLLGLVDRTRGIASRGASGIVYYSSGWARLALPDSLQLVSEYGDLTTLGEVRRGVAP